MRWEGNRRPGVALGMRYRPVVYPPTGLRPTERGSAPRLRSSWGMANYLGEADVRGAILSGVYFTPTPGHGAVTRHAVRATATEEDSQNLPHSVLSVERSLVNELSPSPR